MTNQDESFAADARRPAMIVRVAVTGAIAAPEPGSPAYASIRAQVAEALAAVCGEIAAARADPRARACFADAAPELRCLTQLAEGSDRLFAEVALEQAGSAGAAGIAMALDVVLPFAAEEYRTTFRQDDGGASVTAFDALLGRAERVLTLDGDVASDLLRPRSYEAAGRVMVRNADLVVAIWDDATTPKGRGGTRDTIEFALRSNVPVWWIDAKGEAAPRLLTDLLDLSTAPADPGEPARALGRYLRAILVPPPPEAAGGILKRRRIDPLFDYLAEPLRMNRDFWLVHARLVGSLRRTAARLGGHSPARRVKPPLGERARRWAQLSSGRARFDAGQSIPNQLSLAYQHRYRTSYIAVLLGAAVALISAAIGLANPERFEFGGTIAEFAALVPAGLLVWLNNHDRWHERYISYRLLGELARPERLLSQLGWTLPYGQVRKAAGPNPQNWIAWLAAAYTRTLPLPEGRICDALPAIRSELADGMLQGQIDFHDRRHRECHGAGLWLGRAGTLLFQLTLLLVAMKMVLVFQSHHPAEGHVSPSAQALAWLSYFTAILPAFSAVAFGLKAYEEFEPLSELSQEMSAELRGRRERVARVDLARPLASQTLGEEAFEAASVMLSEVGGWAQLFRSRPVEA